MYTMHSDKCMEFKLAMLYIQLEAQWDVERRGDGWHWLALSPGMLSLQAWSRVKTYFHCLGLNLCPWSHVYRTWFVSPWSWFRSMEPVQCDQGLGYRAICRFWSCTRRFSFRLHKKGSWLTLLVISRDFRNSWSHIFGKKSTFDNFF